jgi:peptidoglycan LD-endopeptidase LytH
MRVLSLLFAIYTAALCGPIEEWDRFEKEVRDQTIPIDRLKAAFPAVYDSIQRCAAHDRFSDSTRWFLPFKTGTSSDIGKGGFKPDSYYGGSPVKGYNFFDGNRHGGHPAYDIFIRDKNADCKDDATGKPAEVVAPEDLLVLSVNTSWTKESPVRGGRYVWGYIPKKEYLVYFAHLDTIYVSGGTIVRAGRPIGTIGRTGTNANSPRSPTHLHMMVLRYEKGKLDPVDFIKFFR